MISNQPESGHDSVRVEYRRIPEVKARLTELGLIPEQRRSDFVYAEDWKDWSEATEAADEQLRSLSLHSEDAATPGTAPRRSAAAGNETASAVQNLMVLYATETATAGNHWFPVDAWIAEQAARDAQRGLGTTGAERATPWSGKQAEFEVAGVWMRIEHRRRNPLAAREESGRIGLLAEVRILEPERARRTHTADAGEAPGEGRSA